MTQRKAKVDACLFIAAGTTVEAERGENGTLIIKSGAISADEADFEPLTHPAPTFSATSAAIKVGESVTLNWYCPEASGIYLDGHGVTGAAGSAVRKPTITTKYTLRVEYHGEEPTYLEVTVIVTPASTGWEASYYNNTSLTGQPVFTTTTDVIGYNWGTGSPSPLVLANNFSARFTRLIVFDAAEYEFTVTADDGVRVYVDGTVLIDRWVEQAATTIKARKVMTAGNHTIKIEYFEKGGNAVLVFSHQKVASPVIETKRRIGVHFLNSRARAEEMIAQGLRDAVFIDDIDGCKWFCDLLGKTSAFDGKGTVMYRHYIDYWPSSPQQLFEICHGADDPRIIKIGTNETEFSPHGNSVQGVLDHAALDVATAELCAQAGSCYALGTFAVGNPDITNPLIVDALERGYANWWNTGYARTGVRPVWDQHEYSPDENHIYNTWEGDIVFQVPTAGMISEVGAEEYRALGYDVIVEYVGERNIQVNSLRRRSMTSSQASAPALLTTGKAVHVYEQDWHETRTKFLFALCGFNLRSGGVLVSSETGLDKGGFGGFLGCGVNGAGVTRWMRRYREIFLRPVMDDFGHNEPMPKESSNIFQGTDAQNGAGHWGSYYVGGFIPDMAVVWREQ